MVKKVKSFGTFGIGAFDVTVEVAITGGLPAFDIVGLPDVAVKEAKDRVRSAIKHGGFTMPLGRVTVNLAPANTKKTGPVYDLPIFLALLEASGQLGADLSDCAFIGELSLDGSLRAVNGALAMAIHAADTGCKKFFVPTENSEECSVIRGIDIYPVNNVRELVEHFSDIPSIMPLETKDPILDAITEFNIDFADVKGQESIKRAVIVAAAGGHNMLMIGPPGSGKSMIAKRIPSVLPPMSFKESLETTAIYSVCGMIDRKNPLIVNRPFRAPHHSISNAGMAGGGASPSPGEISLSHNGVLFLDELPEFSRDTKEVLRQPMEDGKITISRASGTISYPCNIMMVAALNPCPCGYLGSEQKACICTDSQISRYKAKVSGPLLDRIDIQVEAAAIDFDCLVSKEKGMSSADMKAQVLKAREYMKTRFDGTDITSNANLTSKQLNEFCKMDSSGQRIMEMAYNRLNLSARGYDKVRKVARTIADIDGSELIQSMHLAEALQYRSIEEKYWSNY